MDIVQGSGDDCVLRSLQVDSTKFRLASVVNLFGKVYDIHVRIFILGRRKKLAAGCNTTWPCI